MATAPLTGVLQHIRQLAGGAAPERTDRQLLDDFAGRRDETAFAALVARHGPLVLRVCRHVLGHEQDAEDAFQATFLVLAGSAATIRRREAVAGWLHGVARRTALKAKRTAARRRARERQAQPAAPPSPPGLLWEEVRTVLDEEVGRLAEPLRSAFVLCALESKSAAQAAAALGCKKGTIHTRLNRARRLLQKALAARGIELAALQGALAVADGALRAVPTALTRSTVQFGSLVAAGEPAARVIPSRVAALAAGVTGVMESSKHTIATALVLAGLLLAGVGTGALAPPGPGGEEAPSRQATAKSSAAMPQARPEARERTLTGRVLGADRKPITADLFLLWLDGAPEPLGKTAADGTFRVTVPLGEPGAYLVARAGGHGVDFMMPALNTPTEVTFRLPKDTPIRGRVIDTQGKPVAGVELSVGSMSTFSRERLDRFLAVLKTRASHEPLPPGERSLRVRREASHTLPNGERLLAARTDADGRFVLANVGADRTACVDVRGGGIAEHRILVIAREGFDPASINRVEEGRRRRERRGNLPTLAAPRLIIVAEAEKVIRGVVRETDTGRPRAGVRVSLESDDFPRLPRLFTVTDGKGRYEIRGAKKAAAYRLAVRRDPADAMLGRTIKVADTTTGLEPLTADIGVARGVLLTGRVLNVATGRPVRGFACVGILAGNTAIRSRPEYAEPDCYDEAETDRDGVFRTVVIPGRLLLMGGSRPGTGDGPDSSVRYQQQRFDPAYPECFDERMSGFRNASGGVTFIQGQSSKVLTIRPGDKAVTADVLLQPATGFPLRFQDADGKPVRETFLAGNTSADGRSAVSNSTDTGTVYDLDTHHPRLIVVYQPRRQLAVAVMLKGDEKAPGVVTLGPAGSARGKLLDAEGKPLANAAVRVRYVDRAADEVERMIAGVRYESGQEVMADAAGEFVVRPLIPGRRFNVAAVARGKEYQPQEIKRGQGYVVGSGKTTDLGTIRLRGGD